MRMLRLENERKEGTPQEAEENSNKRQLVGSKRQANSKDISEN